ncbi:fungal-specific transcription factor domain-containing protein [Aspergillus heterothallicus]
MAGMRDSSRLLRRQRLKVASACPACRSKKVKCDGTRPACTRPVAPTQKPPSIGPRIQSRNTPPEGRYATFSPTCLQTPSQSEPTTPAFNHPITFTSRSEKYQEAPSGMGHIQAYNTTHGRFAGQVAAAIDKRVGLPPAHFHRVPFVDAPLFESLILPDPSASPHVIRDLAPRNHADQLIQIYWRHIDPIEAVLDRQRFTKNYQIMYTNPKVSASAISDIWLAILNAVFALAVQRQEHLPREQRNDEANRFFLRAWALLPAEAMMWKPPSIELVQCIFLLNRYLHCTDNQHKTWITAGLAVRIAQSLCCHVGEPLSSRSASDETILKEKVWANCVALDRCISWSLGKTSTLMLLPMPTSSVQRPEQITAQALWTSRLYEIGAQIQLAQIQTRTTLPVHSRPLSPSQQDEYCHAALQFDDLLRQWEASLPVEWQFQNLKNIGDVSCQAERYVLHLRYLHHRIFLFRPMLARVYSMKSNSPQSQSQPSLSERLLHEGATMCIGAAQQLSSLVIETMESSLCSIGILPWWYRIYVLHIAGSNLLAAMFLPELFTDPVARSWDALLVTLRAHEHLSLYVPQCISIFETLAARIRPAALQAPDGSQGVLPSELCFDDIFQDIDFELDGFLFGPWDQGHVVEY